MEHDITQMTVKGKCIKGVGLELWFGKKPTTIGLRAHLVRGWVLEGPEGNRTGKDLGKGRDMSKGSLELLDDVEQQ